MRIRTAVLISGRGSNLKSLIAACAAPDFPATIALVLSNVPDAPALNHARAAGISEQIIPYTEYKRREDFDAALDTALQEGRIELVCLAGFMRMLGDRFVAKWQGRLINIHPSLLPSFKGTRVHERVIESGARISGCTVHYVTPEMDSGPAIAQAAVPVRAYDTAESLAARVLEAEHRIYPLALKMVAQRRVWLENGKTVFSEYGFPAGFLINPVEN
jgi:formyltetrahydrofolate-dependent phosphoribosylglycinamide formyltransferase